MVKYLDHYDARPADMSGIGSGVEEWADKWGAIIGKAMVNAEARAAAKQRTTTIRGGTDLPAYRVRATAVATDMAMGGDL
jgi:hypothetical protein